MDDKNLMRKAEKYLIEFEKRMNFLVSYQFVILSISLLFVVLIALFRKSVLVIIILLALVFLFVVFSVFLGIYAHSPAYEIYKLMSWKFGIKKLPVYPSLLLDYEKGNKATFMEDAKKILRDMKFEKISVDKNGVVSGINRMDARGPYTKINPDWMLMKRYHYQIAKVRLDRDKLILSVCSRYPGIDLFKLAMMRDKLAEYGYKISEIHKVTISKEHKKRQTYLWAVYLLLLLFFFFLWIIWRSLEV